MKSYFNDKHLNKKHGSSFRIRTYLVKYWPRYVVPLVKKTNPASTSNTPACITKSEGYSCCSYQLPVNCNN